jgi:hypothetical protein
MGISTHTKKKERLLTFGGNFPGNFNPRSKSQNVSDFALLQKENSLYQLLTIASLIAYTSSLLLLRDLLKFWRPESSPLFQLLTQASKNIVWIYLFEVRLSPFGIDFKKELNFCFGLMNRDMLQIRIPEKDAQKLMENLEIILLHTSFGYSKEKEQLFGIHPELLLKD